ncbi:MAG: MFS transporter [Acetobacteraceae bacterium]
MSDTRTATAAARRVPRVGTVVLSLLCAMYLILYVDRVNISTAAPLLQAELGLSNGQLGLAFSAFAYPYAFFQLFGGWLGDRFGARRVLTLCGVLVCVATVATGAVGGLASLFAARLALGFGEGAMFPTATHAMARWVPRGRYGFAQGITHAFARFGNALTPPLIAGLTAVSSWRVSFFALGAVSLIWVLAWFWYFRDDPRRHPRMSAAELETLPLPRAAGVGAPKVRWWRLARRMLPVTAVDFCYGWTLWLFLSWIPSFFFKAYHLDLKSSALFSAGVFLAGVVGDTVGGVLSDAILRRTGRLAQARAGVIAAGLLGAAAFLMPLLFVRDLSVVTLCLTAAFFCAELVVAPIWAVPMDIAPRQAGTASGMMNLGFGLAGIISPVVFGYALDVTGSWTVPFLASIVLLCAGAAMTLLMRPDRPFDDGHATVKV